MILSIPSCLYVELASGSKKAFETVLDFDGSRLKIVLDDNKFADMDGVQKVSLDVDLSSFGVKNFNLNFFLFAGDDVQVVTVEDEDYDSFMEFVGKIYAAMKLSESLQVKCDVKKLRGGI